MLKRFVVLTDELCTFLEQTLKRKLACSKFAELSSNKQFGRILLTSIFKISIEWMGDF